MASVSKDTLQRLGIVFVTELAGISEYRLTKNGLKILLKENHAAPVTNFMVAYPCGSRDEGAGNTGSAHFFEHLMFKGTRAFDPDEGNGPMEVFQRVGAFINANTSRDRTRYFECVPSEHLELCVRIEADRMRGLKNRKRDRNSEMTVVRSEFEINENNPGSALYKEVVAAAFREHPYHHPVIGWRTDIEGISLARMVEFYDAHYWPNNATALVIGDFDPENALTLIAKYFGRIKRSPEPIPQVYTVEPPQEGERRVKVCRAGDQPQLMIAYHIPEALHPDYPKMSALCRILGGQGDPNSRFYKALVETKLVSSIGAGSEPNRDPGLMYITATPVPGNSLESIEAVIYAELEKLAAEGATDEELTRVKVANRKGTALANDDPNYFCNMVSMAEGIGDWKWIVTFDDHFDETTSDEIKRLASTYFKETNRTVGHFIPTEKEASAKAASQAAPQVEAKPVNKKPRKQKRIAIKRGVGKRATFADRVVTRVLPNGLTLNVLHTPGTGTVAVDGAVYAGSYFAPRKTVAHLTAAMLSKGSAKYDLRKVGAIMGTMGLRLNFGADSFASSFADLLTLADFDQYLDVVADALINPSFAEAELAKVKIMWDSALKRADNDTAQRAQNKLARLVYFGKHPYVAQEFGASRAEIAGLTPDDLKAFHASAYGPKSTILTLVGDIDVDTAVRVVTEKFGAWESAAERKSIVAPRPEYAMISSRSFKEQMADKSNVDIAIGTSTKLTLGSEDYFAAVIANAALGKSTIADRLGKRLRVNEGLTYGIVSYFGFSAREVMPFDTPWTITLKVNPANVDKALGLVNQVVADYVRNGISPEELEDKVEQQIGGFVVALRSTAGMADAITKFTFRGLGVEAMDTLAENFRAVTKDEVDAAIRKYFDLSNTITVIAGTV